ncbi:MAG: type VI secretion system tip protein TssI/VgrG [Pseudomonadota bacterium]
MHTLPANLERYLFEVSGSDEELRVLSFGVTEGISQLFSIDLELATENDALDFEQIVGQAGILTIQQYEEEEPRYFHGIISRLEQGTSGLRFTTYNATIVPQIWYLMHRHNCRIFQKMSVRDIVQKILSDFGLPGDEYQFILQTDPPKREYCVQYRESEFDFISRLLEEEGIFYFFEHHNNKHILVMGDSTSAHKAIQEESKIIFHEPRPGQVADEPHIYTFNYTEEILSGKVSLKDYNFKKPALNLKGEKTGDKNTELEVYDYPGKFDDPGRGNNLAKVRLEEYQTVKKEGSGATTCTHFAAGFFFIMEEYPREDFNKKYLLTQHQISGSQPQVLEETAGEGGTSFSSSFECIPFEVPYRPDRVTPKPVVEGSQTAIVVGPQGEEIYTNEHGQVKVQFHWDREGNQDENSSCWIRVSQLWAGAGWGAMFIPRIGHEVIVDFLEGDPDRPIITGRVYHGTNKPPYSLPAEKTKSTIKTRSLGEGQSTKPLFLNQLADTAPKVATLIGGISDKKKAVKNIKDALGIVKDIIKFVKHLISGLEQGNSNEIRFEDKPGKEELYIHAKKDAAISVENNLTTNVAAGESLTVVGSRNKVIGDSESSFIVGDDGLVVGGNKSNTIYGDFDTTLEGVDFNSMRTCIAPFTDPSAGNIKSAISAAKKLASGGCQGHYTLTVKKGNYTTTITKCDHKLIVEGKKSGHQTVRIKKGNRSIDARGEETYRVRKKRRVEIKGDETHTNKGKFTHKVTKDYVLEVKGNLTIKANKIKIESTGGSMNLKARTELKSEAGTQLINKARTALHNKAGTSLTNQAKLKLTNKAGVSLTNEAKMLTNKGSAMQNVKASGVLIIKGSMVIIN